MDFTGKKVLVVGLARSGLAAIKVLHKLNAEIVLSETKAITDEKTLALLNEYNVQIVDQSLEVFDVDYDLCVKNPGVPYRSEKIEKLHQHNVPVITEIELAYIVSKPQHYVAITGTNGKTTTTTLVYEILKSAFGDKAHVGGNIGIPLCELVMDYNLMEQEGHYIALEMSNFQLVNIDKFRPDVAVIMNLTPDHIDFMGGLENYYKSKTEIYRNMKDEDVFILNSDDSLIQMYTEKYPVHCQINHFSLDSTDTDSYIKDGYMYVNGQQVLPIEAIKLVGKHNKQNVMAAICAAKAVGISNENIVQAISNFKGVEHRIEFVRQLNGVRFYNDSKGTNTDATITALKAFDQGVILLVGGYEKGLDMSEMRNYLGCVKKVIGYGYCGPRLVKDLVGEDGIVVDALPAAVAKAVEIAESGDIVLLSPTTSSFDQYSCFEERGEHFKSLVNAL